MTAMSDIDAFGKPLNSRVLSMQSAPATEQARFEAYYRLSEKAKQRDPDPEFAHRYYDEIVQAKWEGWQDRATQAERVQSAKD